MVERAGIDRDFRGSARKRGADRGAEQPRPDPEARPFRHQTEIGKIRTFRGSEIQLVIAGWRTFRIEHEDFYAAAVDLAGERFVIELQALHPEPAAAHGTVEIAIEVQRNLFRFHQCQRR
jgi:hypothetical protein